MTREEASFILANIDRRVCDDELSEALDMAIKALEQNPKYKKEAKRWKNKALGQRPKINPEGNVVYGRDGNLYELTLSNGKEYEQEPCEDCISRKEAILQLQRYGVGCFDADDFSVEQCTRFVIDKLRDLPPVAPQTKIGHWILTVEDWNRWTCSECDFTKRTDIHVTLGYNYCPKCGAKMEGEEV